MQAQQYTSGVAISAIWEAKEGEAEAVAGILARLGEAARTEPGVKLFLVHRSVANPAHVSPARADDCATAGTQYAMDQCAQQSFKKTDAELNALYGQITARLKSNPPIAQSLVSAQKAWLVFSRCRVQVRGFGQRGGQRPSADRSRVPRS